MKAKHLFYLILSCSLLFSCGKSNALKQEDAERTIKAYLTENTFETSQEIISVETIRKIDQTNVFTQFNTSVKVHFSGKPETRDSHLLFIFTRTPKNKWFLESIEAVGEVFSELAQWLTTKRQMNISIIKSYSTKANKENENVLFDFSATRVDSFKETIEIKAYLYNNSSDTISFLTTTCDGEQYLLQYDTLKFRLKPFMNCNASYPRIQRINPKEKYEFLAHFGASSDETKIRIGFDFYQVDKSFDLKKISLNDIINRPKKNILSAKEKTFESGHLVISK